jgi:hypothetical protein
VRKFATRAVIGILAVAATIVAAQAPAQASGGGCNTYDARPVWQYAICISQRGNTVYPDFYIYRSDFSANCTATFYLMKPNGTEKLWSARCDRVTLGHYGPWARSVATGPALCSRGKLVITGVPSHYQLGPQVCS